MSSSQRGNTDLVMRGKSLQTGQARLLAVDDDPGILEVERDVLTAEGYAIETARSGEEAVQKLRSMPFDLALSDLRMPTMGGLDLLKEFASFDPEMPVIILTGHGDIASAVESIKRGAYDYLTKPLHI